MLSRSTQSNILASMFTPLMKITYQDFIFTTFAQKELELLALFALNR